ncbi:hypothetical protein Q0590_31045 [Rhodocytophaga aerolata]|uniref:Uncharacterized protein n=1 Tax=Rhodocytophaga aerolata TaxID=455078 RepID=A0ABT8RF59_9BACT|nr:hypothetical protein [Rhodocytophaga aerolata]MDO1450751.1 hypothetical protein [Rhodocytophaga aerolata]
MNNEKKGFKNTLRASLQNSTNPSTDEINNMEITDSPYNTNKSDNTINTGREDKKNKPIQILEPVKPVKLTMEVTAEYAELLEREAFWERMTLKAIMAEMLEHRYQGKKFKPIPENKRPTKRGPKKKSQL